MFDHSTFDLTGKHTIPADANQSLQVSSRGKSKTVQHLRATPHQDEPPIHEVASHGDAIHTTKFVEQEQMEGISATARRRLGRRRYGGRRRQGQGGNRRGRREGNRGRNRRRNDIGYGQRGGRGRNRNRGGYGRISRKRGFGYGREKNQGGRGRQGRRRNGRGYYGQRGVRGRNRRGRNRGYRQGPTTRAKWEPSFGPKKNAGEFLSSSHKPFVQLKTIILILISMISSSYH